MIKSLIKYSLFQKRKKFDPLSLFRQNKLITYEEFVKILSLKGSDSPGIEYFERVKSHFESLNKPQETAAVINQEKPEAAQEKPEADVGKVEEINVKTEAFQVKPKKRRQRKKVEEKNHDKKDNDE